jgi:hypothetical protein
MANNSSNEASVSTRACTRCKGNGFKEFKGFTALDGTVYPDAQHKCHSCGGSGFFAPINLAALLTEITGRKGLVSKRPEGRRAYYVWRMARFSGGRDVTLPMSAGYEIAGDPFVKELDQIADHVAKTVYGTDRAAAYRWAPLLTNLASIPDGMPASAYAGGPVLMDNDKPEEELLELR